MFLFKIEDFFPKNFDKHLNDYKLGRFHKNCKTIPKGTRRYPWIQLKKQVHKDKNDFTSSCSTMEMNQILLWPIGFCNLGAPRSHDGPAEHTFQSMESLWTKRQSLNTVIPQTVSSLCTKSKNDRQNEPAFLFKHHFLDYTCELFYGILQENNL